MLYSIYFLIKNSKSVNWVSGVYDKNSIVKYKNHYYQAIEEKNGCEPDDYLTKIIYVR